LDRGSAYSSEINENASGRGEAAHLNNAFDIGGAYCTENPLDKGSAYLSEIDLNAFRRGEAAHLQTTLI
jgi:hypothetical protein